MQPYVRHLWPNWKSRLVVEQEQQQVGALDYVLAWEVAWGAVAMGRVARRGATVARGLEVGVRVVVHKVGVRANVAGAGASEEVVVDPKEAAVGRRVRETAEASETAAVLVHTQ